ncbi:2-hydroxychromene-2-carboxylate isomerase [Oxalobacteraceae bacterium OM1]|nr:2-hydroxychromene-2-carboxylate isomerase [Oxalobacteraceae bacterium OM1]
MQNPPSLECWFEFGSNYSYLSVMRIEFLARDAGIPLVWKPFLLGPIFRDFGWESSPFVLQPAKGRYMWRDMEREAAKYDLPFRKPSVFPRLAVLPMRVAALGATEPWMGEFCRRVMRQNWVDDFDINAPHHVAAALEGLVADPQAILAAAQTDDNKLRLRGFTDEARDRGIFGAPTFFVGEEMFWGNDRLQDALAWAGRCAPASLL